MIITIDTTQPLTLTDRALLTALLSPGPVGVPTPAHDRPLAPVSPFLARLAEAARPAKTAGAMAEARLPVTQQAGVRSAPSVEDSDEFADDGVDASPVEP